MRLRCPPTGDWRRLKGGGGFSTGGRRGLSPRALPTTGPRVRALHPILFTGPWLVYATRLPRGNRASSLPGSCPGASSLGISVSSAAARQRRGPPGGCGRPRSFASPRVWHETQDTLFLPAVVSPRSPPQAVCAPVAFSKNQLWDFHHDCLGFSVFSFFVCFFVFLGPHL